MWRLGAAAVLAAAAVLIIAPGSPAAAQQGGLSCTSSTDTEFKPGLLLQPQQVKVTIDGSLEPCTDLSGQAITAGGFGAKLQAVRSCADLLAPSQGEYRIDWNGGTHGFSVISYSRTTTTVGGTIVTTEVGTVVQGDFSGHATLATTVGPHNPAACLSPPGVQQVHTNGTLTISP